MDKFILTTTELTAKVEDPQLKKHNVSDRSTSFSDNGRGRGRNTQTVYSTIQDEQITTHTQNEEIKKLLTMIYDKIK